MALSLSLGPYHLTVVSSAHCGLGPASVLHLTVALSPLRPCHCHWVMLLQARAPCTCPFRRRVSGSGRWPLSISKVPRVTGVGTVTATPRLPASGARQQLSTAQAGPGVSWMVWNAVPTCTAARSHPEGHTQDPWAEERASVGPGKQRACSAAPRSLPRPGSPSCHPDPGRGSSLGPVVLDPGPRPHQAREGSAMSPGSAAMPWALAGLLCPGLQSGAQGQGCSCQAPVRGQAWVWPEGVWTQRHGC